MTSPAKRRATIATKFAEEFSAYERLAALMQELLDANAEKIVTAPGLPSTTVVAGLFAKAMKSFHAVHLLARGGYGEDAMDIARTLTNLCIDLGYICHKDSDARSRQWIAFGALERLKMQRAVTGKLTKTQEARQGRLKTLTKSWTDLKIEGRAKQSGRFMVYATAYRHLSSYSHSDSWSTGSFLKDSGQVLHALNEPSETCVDEALYVSAMVTYDIASTWGRFFSMDTTGFDRAAQSLLDSVFTKGL
jgi:Family of unknown function (DUF5677)